MKKSIIIDYKEYICSDDLSTVTDDDVIFEIVDKVGRMSYVVAGPTDLLGDCVKHIWKIESVEDLSESLFAEDMVYDDEYYKSTYFPTIEEEEEARKLFNETKKENGGN
jgi:hypothetical protein